jgi:DNA mismatch repair protein MSH6
MAPKAKPPPVSASGGLKQGSLFSFFTQKAIPKPPPTSAHSSSPSAPQTEAPTPKTTRINPLLDQVHVGCRVEVYWLDDDEYYSARVTRQNKHQFYLEYEADGQCEWIDLSQETFRLLKDQPTKKRRRIQEDDDNVDKEGEEEEEFSEEAEFGNDEESEYDNNADDSEDEKELADDDQWMVTDDEDDQKVEQLSKKNKKRPTLSKKLKVSIHDSAPPKLDTTPRPAPAKKSPLDSFGHSPCLPQAVTPALSRATTSPPAKKTPQATTPSPTAPPLFVRDAINPAGSHLHHHLPFCRNPRDGSGRTPDHTDYDPRTLTVVSSDWTRLAGKPMTDAVAQWWHLKAQYKDAVLLFKTGKFYELFHMDADVGVQVLGLLYMKGHVAHAGFPEISYGAMADRLVRAGYKVARVEQTETPENLVERKRLAKRAGKQQQSPKVVNREVCSVLTLGTRTFCYLDQDTAGILSSAATGDEMVGPLLAIREILVDQAAGVGDDDDHVRPECEYGITLVDAMRGTVTIGQFADDVLRSRMSTLLTAFCPSEILVHSDASPTLLSLIRSVQSVNPHPFRLETIQSEESFPKSTALDAAVRSEMDRGRGSRVHPWDVEETLAEIHRRKYYPRSSKVKQDTSVSRWPQVLRAAVEGRAELALSSFGSALYYLQRNLIDAELLSMGVVKAYIPPLSSAASMIDESSDCIQQLASYESRVESGVDPTALLSPQASAPAGSGQLQLDNRVEIVPVKESLHLESQVDHMALDGTTLHNLEILTNSVDYKTKGSLWSKINYTKTPHGSRLLRAWLLRPLFRKPDIERRADAVEELASGAGAAALSDATSVLSKCGDIERLLSRVHSMSGNCSLDEDDGPSVGVHPNERAVLYETGTYAKRKVGDFSKVLNGLRYASQIPEIFHGIGIRSGLLRKIVCHSENGGCFPDMVQELDWFFSNFDCDQAAKGLFEPTRGIDSLYDQACEAMENIEARLDDYKNEMCSNVLTPRVLAKSSWKYANTKPESKDKYMIELMANVAVPDEFIMKGKRGSGPKQVNKYRTADVQALVDELERAIDIQKERKARGMQLIFAKFDSKRTLWAAAAQATALLDALSSLAHVASRAGFTRPIILECPLDGGSPSLSVVQGRHPCVDNTFGTCEFVPNDLSLGSVAENGPEPRVLLLSGPNMGGTF